MIGLSIEFLAGRFHATPWDRSVNEGDVEWPPAPWRILRALVASFHLIGETDASILAALCTRLAIAPRFLLPPSTAGHTRHYMPQDGLSVSKGLVLDAFVAFSDRRARAYVLWDTVTLSSDEERLLARISAGISYFGRVETWCAVTPITSAPAADGLIPVALAFVSSGEPGPAVRRLGVKSDFQGADLLASLAETTNAMRKRRSVLPRGAAWLTYQFPPDFGRDRVAAICEAKRADFPSRVLRFRLEGPSPNVLPSLTEALHVADVFRSTVLSVQGKRGELATTPLFSGKSSDGTPLTGENHAYFLPRDRDGDGLLDTVDVYLPRTFSHDEYRALTSVARLYAYGFKLAPDEYYRVTFLGDAPREAALRWRSETPFILPRYEKRRGSGDVLRTIDTPEEQIRRELAFRALTPAMVTVERGASARIPLRGGRSAFAGSFRRVRSGDTRAREAVTAVLEFDTPVVGPIALGMHAHFGLGQFVPDHDAVRVVAS